MRILEEKLKAVNKKNLDVKLKVYITVLIIFITTATLFASTVISVKTSYDRTEKDVQQQLNFAAKSFEEWLNNNKSLIVAIQMNKNIQKYCLMDKKNKIEYSDARKLAMEALENEVNLLPEINFIAVVNSSNTDYVYAGNYTITDSRYEELAPEVYKSCVAANKNNVLLIHMGDVFFRGKRTTASFFNPVFSTEYINKEVGKVCINMNENLLGNIEDGEETELFLTDQNGNLMSGYTNKILLDYDGKKEGTLRQNGKYYFFKKIEGWNFYIVKTCFVMEFFGPILHIIGITVLIVGVLLWSGIRLVNKLVKKNYQPLADVVSAMDTIKNNKLDYRIDTENMGEDFQKLGSGFNQMMDEIVDLMERMKEEQHQKDQIKFNALQSQIQPHFLYNTLECIHWQAVAVGNKDISKLVLALASYYRMSLRKGRDLITVEEELEHIKCYLMIQKQRYGEGIKYDISVDKSFGKVDVPKLTLQPLVENAIYHGIRIKEGASGYIKITAEQKDDSIVIQVADSGKGMSEDEVQEMNQSLSIYDEAFGYGVRNVHKRIQLFFGDVYGLKYELNEDGGVTAFVKLPLRTRL